MTQQEQQNQQQTQTQEQTQKKHEQNQNQEEEQKIEENTSLIHTKIQPTYDPETGGLIFHSEEEEKLKSNQKKNNVNPYDVQIVDYNKLVDDFGCSLITREQVKKIENLTKVPAHPWLKREIFFSHRDLDVILNEYEKGNKFYLYTGRGPSGDRMHLGHLMPFIFTKYLQDAFNVPLVIQLTDDEKFFHKGETTLEEYQRMGIENAKDIIACGFDVDKTFIFLDTEYIGHMYMNVCKFQKNITYNQLKGIFGVNQSDIIGKMSYPAIQAAPALSSSFKHIFGDKIVPCLVPQGIDQDAYFRMTRDVCQRLKVPKTACIHNKFFPALQGFNSKMSTSDPNSAIFLTDTPQEIKDKINKHAFSGGQQTKELQEKFGANLEVDIPYQYLNFFLNDDAELKKIGEDYSSGKILTSSVKGKLIELLQKIISDHQEKRAKVTDEQVRKFMEIRKLNF